MKKALCNLIFIVVELDRAILKYDKVIMPKQDLIRLRLLTHLRDDINETIEVYRSEQKNF